MSLPAAAPQPNALSTRMNSLLGVVLPERTPAATHVQGASTPDGLMQSTLTTVGNLAPPFQIPYQQPIVDLMRQTFGMVPNVQLIDTATASTMENFDDLPLERPVAIAPFSNGVHNEYTEYMPLFSVHDCQLNTMPGFEVVVTPVVINNVQRSLAEQSQTELLREFRDMQAIRELTSNEKRRRTIAMQRAHRKSMGVTLSRASWNDVELLSAIGALDVESLGAKLGYLGPMTKEYTGTVNNPQRRYYGTSGASPVMGVSERIVNWAYYTRGKIFNMFSVHPHRGDQLFFSVGEYAPDELDHMHSGYGASNQQRSVSRKRKAETSFVGRRSTGASIVQIRGWSSRDGMPQLFSSGWHETADEQLVERHLRTCAQKLAYEYREYEQDPLTGEMVAIDVGDGDLQDAVASVPDLIYESYVASRVTFPVGTVKEPYQAYVEPQRLLAAHYDHTTLDALPHMDIYQNF